MIRMIVFCRAALFFTSFIFSISVFGVEKPLYYGNIMDASASDKAHKPPAVKVKKEKKKPEKNLLQPVDINTATADEIDEALVGIGQAKAKLIVEYRDKHGRFKKAADLENVKGIGASIIEKNKNLIRI